MCPVNNLKLGTGVEEIDELLVDSPKLMLRDID